MSVTSNVWLRKSGFSSLVRSRAGTFEPQIVGKHQTRFSGFDEKIISLYARGMLTREIRQHIEEIYQVEISPNHFQKTRPCKNCSISLCEISQKNGHCRSAIGRPHSAGSLSSTRTGCHRVDKIGLWKPWKNKRHFSTVPTAPATTTENERRSFTQRT